MGGTKAGGQKAAASNKAKFGEDFYKKIGAKGGKAHGKGGFYYSKQHGLDWHIEAGRIGGKISRRKYVSDF